MNRLKERLKTLLAPRSADAGDGVPRQPWLEPYDEAASKADILACFRLLLGRQPHLEEWTGHLMHTGEPLDQVVTSYLTSWEFLRRKLTQEKPADFVISELPNFRIYSDLNDSAVGKFVRANDYEPEVTAVFRRLLRPGMGVLDIGANIGYYSLLSAAIVGAAGQVFAVEPNQQNVKLLEASRRLNGFGTITVMPVAAGAETGMLALTTSHSTGTTSTPPQDVTALLNARIVPCAALDVLIPQGRRIDLIKIDVDGAEYGAMRGCERIVERDRPAIISEFAPSLLPGISGVSAEDYLQWFGARNYLVSVIDPDGSTQPMQQRWDLVMAAFQQRGIDHIDILATHRDSPAAT